MTLGDTLSLEQIEALVNDNAPVTPPANADNQQQASSGTTPPVEPKLEGKEGAQVFAARMREVSEKARLDALEQEAKADGYSSYAEKQKARQEKTMKDQGIDPELARPVFEKLMAEDPRVKELEILKAQRVEEFGRQQLSEITTLTGGKIMTLEQISPEVIELWKQKGNLKAAYLYYHGNELISGAQTSAKSLQSKGSTAHLVSPQGSSPANDDGLRLLTNTEKAYFKELNPYYTDEELSKKRIKK